MKKLFLGLAGVLLIASMAFAMGPLMPTILSKSKVVQLKGKILQVNQQNYGCMRGCGPVVLQTDKGNITLYGFGPKWYWNRQNVNLPQLGNNLTVNAFEVNVNGSNYYVVKDVTFANGKNIFLRDNNGYCLWSKKRMKIHGHMNRNMMKCPHITNQNNH